MSLSKRSSEDWYCQNLDCLPFSLAFNVHTTCTQPSKDTIKWLNGLRARNPHREHFQKALVCLCMSLLGSCILSEVISHFLNLVINLIFHLFTIACTQYRKYFYPRCDEERDSALHPACHEVLAVRICRCVCWWRPLDVPVRLTAVDLSQPHPLLHRNVLQKGLSNTFVRSEAEGRGTTIKTQRIITGEYEIFMTPPPR